LVSRRSEDLPGYWALLFMRAAVQHPAGSIPSLPLLLFEKIHGGDAIAFAENRTLGIREDHSFRGHVPTAHTLACLRFADPVTETVARLATGLGGLTPGRAGFVGEQSSPNACDCVAAHPLDDERNFKETSERRDKPAWRSGWKSRTSKG
jgi:hypothetical protein